MSFSRIAIHPVLAQRRAREWSQAELARRAGISRTAVSAVEGERLAPSVTAALALAAALECSVEELFGRKTATTAHDQEWAWPPRFEPCRVWEAEVDRRRLLYPVEATSLNAVPHDGLSRRGVFHAAARAPAETTLTLACCDPAAGLLAAEYARSSGFRMLVFPRNGSAALELLQKRRVHVAGIHRSTDRHPERNAQTVRARLGGGHQLLRVARWEEGIALPPDDASRSVKSLVRRPRHWAAREPGAGARECLDEALQGRRLTGRQVNGHAAVAEAVHAGWADAGVCVRLCAEEAGLNFLPMREEELDFCFSSAMRHDPRIQGLIRLLRSRDYRRLIGELPGYDARQTGELATI